MVLEFTYTIDDVREMLTPPGQRPSRHPPRPRLFAAILVGGIALVTLLFFWFSGSKAFQSKEPEQDLLATLVLTLSPALIVFAWSAALAIQAGGGQQNLKRRRTAGWLWQLAWALAIALVAVTPLIDPIPWHPTRQQMLFVGLLPWLIVLPSAIELLRMSRIRTAVALWTASPVWNAPKRMELTESGIRFHDPHRQNDFSWNYFQTARETENLILLISHTNLSVVLPKRAFTTSTDLDQAKSLIRQKMPGASLSIEKRAFEVVMKAT